MLKTAFFEAERYRKPVRYRKEAAIRGVHWKKVLLAILQNLQENTLSEFLF